MMAPKAKVKAKENRKAKAKAKALAAAPPAAAAGVLRQLDLVSGRGWGGEIGTSLMF